MNDEKEVKYIFQKYSRERKSKTDFFLSRRATKKKEFFCGFPKDIQKREK